ncbi:MAG: hypothetical protein II661_03800, partial [Bacteroidales bacterium]|nr:hypothetical protein [Bacteroidales bacterium]
ALPSVQKRAENFSQKKVVFRPETAFPAKSAYNRDKAIIHSQLHRPFKKFQIPRKKAKNAPS